MLIAVVIAKRAGEQPLSGAVGVGREARMTSQDCVRTKIITKITCHTKVRKQNTKRKDTQKLMKQLTPKM